MIRGSNSLNSASGHIYTLCHIKTLVPSFSLKDVIEKNSERFLRECLLTLDQCADYVKQKPISTGLDY